MSKPKAKVKPAVVWAISYAPFPDKPLRCIWPMVRVAKDSIHRWWGKLGRKDRLIKVAIVPLADAIEAGLVEKEAK